MLLLILTCMYVDKFQKASRPLDCLSSCPPTNHSTKKQSTEGISYAATRYISVHFCVIVFINLFITSPICV